MRPIGSAEKLNRREFNLYRILGLIEQPFLANWQPVLRDQLPELSVLFRGRIQSSQGVLDPAFDHQRLLVSDGMAVGRLQDL